MCFLYHTPALAGKPYAARNPASCRDKLSLHKVIFHVIDKARHRQVSTPRTGIAAWRAGTGAASWRAPHHDPVSGRSTVPFGTVRHRLLGGTFILITGTANWRAPSSAKHRENPQTALRRARPCRLY